MFAAAMEGILFAPIPIASGSVLGILAGVPAIHRWSQACSGLVGPNFVSVALIFGLFATFLANDIWVREQEAADSIERSREMEGDALAGLLFISHSLDAEGDAVEEAAIGYARASISQFQNLGDVSMSSEVEDGLRGMIDAILSIKSGNARLEAARGEMLQAFRKIVDSRADRPSSPSGDIRMVKWLLVMALGILTQISLMAVHVTDVRAARHLSRSLPPPSPCASSPSSCSASTSKSPSPRWRR